MKRRGFSLLGRGAACCSFATEDVAYIVLLYSVSMRLFVYCPYSFIVVRFGTVTCSIVLFQAMLAYLFNSLKLSGMCVASV